MLPATGLAQATPESDRPSPSRILRRYIADVWNDRNPDAIADFFQPDAFDLMDARRQHVILIDGLAEGPRPVHISAITENDLGVAMAFGTIDWASSGEAMAFVVVAVDDSGLITAYQWLWD